MLYLPENMKLKSSSSLMVWCNLSKFSLTRCLLFTFQKKCVCTLQRYCCCFAQISDFCDFTHSVLQLHSFVKLFGDPDSRQCSGFIVVRARTLLVIHFSTGVTEGKHQSSFRVHQCQAGTDGLRRRDGVNVSRLYSLLSKFPHSQARLDPGL